MPKHHDPPHHHHDHHGHHDHHDHHDHKGRHDHKDRHHHHSRGASLSFVERDDVDAILAKLLPDDRERGLVLRCILDEGPAHHRGANFVLIKLLALLAGEIAPAPEGIPVPMRLPPHVAGHTDSVYPLRLPLAPLELLSTDPRAVEAMTDCLLDGPPQHALANVLMVCLIDALLRKHATPPTREP